MNSTMDFFVDVPAVNHYCNSTGLEGAKIGDHGAVSTVIIVLVCLLAFVHSLINIVRTLRIPVATFGMESSDSSINSSLLASGSGRGGEDGEIDTSVNQKVFEISAAIQRGAKAFLHAEYQYMGVFIVVFGAFVLFAVGAGKACPPGSGSVDAEGMFSCKDDEKVTRWHMGVFTAIAFVFGAVTSMVSGYIGMMIAVQANSRTALQAQRGYAPAFRTAFEAASVMGFALCGLALIVLLALIGAFRGYFGWGADARFPITELFEAIAGYGLGGSSIALFGRVGGGIYTKAADVGADLVGKVEQGIPEDDPRNPAVIADNVGDNVGDVAGMGADLFGSFAESSCAALVVAASSPTTVFTENWNTMMFPLMISASGIIACYLTSFVATYLTSVKRQDEIEPTLKRQLLISTVLETILLWFVCDFWLPARFCVAGSNHLVKNWGIFICAASGLWSGLIIGYVTEYYTSHTYKPVRELASACKTGAATNIIYGLALGYKSTIIPVITLAIAIFFSYYLGHMFGVACAALGILSTLSIGLTIDAYGPISDNAGGIAEMAGLGDHVRQRTDALDSAGNTTAAVGKGFAIGSAAFVSLALFGAFVTRVQAVDTNFTVNILEPLQFSGLLVGAMLPYWFSAMTMKSVGKAALAMVEEVRRQFRDIPGIMEGTGLPDYESCVAISTKSSLHEMIAPGVLVMGTPIVVGFLLGTSALSGVLAGSLVSSVQCAISMSNAGGAYDNGKKYIESGAHGGKGSDAHRAAVVGDTVGDPLKDTSGPSLNILMKLAAVESLVLVSFFTNFSIPALAHWNPNAQ
jgi:inorganic pyrophosphatase